VSCTPGTHPTGLQEPPPETSVPELSTTTYGSAAPRCAPIATVSLPTIGADFFDFGTGQIGNWGIHTMGPVKHGLQLGAPTSVRNCEGCGTEQDHLSRPRRDPLRVPAALAKMRR